MGTVTFTLIVQLLLGASVPPVKRMPGSPAASAPPVLSNSDPPHVLDVLSGVATTMAPGEVGNVSVKLSPLTVTGVGLVNVKVNAETPPTLVGSGLKFFEIVTAEGSKTYA